MRNRARLSPSQIRQIWAALEPEKRAQAAERAKRGGTPWKFPGGSRPETGTTRDVIGAMAGVSGRTVEKCLAVYEAAASDPALFGPVVEYLERSENIHDAHNRMRRVADQARVRGMAPIAGRFATLVLDPPWQDESVSPNQRPPYATMPVAEIAAVPVPTWQLDEGHIYVHCPGPFLYIAIGLVGNWGYEYKQALVYRKNGISMGRYFRTKDEFVVFGTRGGLMLARQDLPNEFEGTPGEHSAKPDSFYALVEAASQPSFGEAFQRKPRPGFRNLYELRPLAPIAVAAE